MEMLARMEQEQKRVSEVLAAIDRDALRQEFEGLEYQSDGLKRMFVEAGIAVLDDPQLLRTIAANAYHPDWSFSEVVRDAVAERIARQTPRGWVEPMYISGTRPPRELCELLRDRILTSLGRTHAEPE